MRGPGLGPLGPSGGLGLGFFGPQRDGDGGGTGGLGLGCLGSRFEISQAFVFSLPRFVGDGGGAGGGLLGLPSPLESQVIASRSVGDGGGRGGGGLLGLPSPFESRVIISRSVGEGGGAGGGLLGFPSPLESRLVIPTRAVKSGERAHRLQSVATDGEETGTLKAWVGAAVQIVVVILKSFRRLGREFLVDIVVASSVAHLVADS